MSRPAAPAALTTQPALNVVPLVATWVTLPFATLISVTSVSKKNSTPALQGHTVKGTCQFEGAEVAVFGARTVPPKRPSARNSRYYSPPHLFRPNPVNFQAKAFLDGQEAFQILGDFGVIGGEEVAPPSMKSTSYQNFRLQPADEIQGRLTDLDLSPV